MKNALFLPGPLSARLRRSARLPQRSNRSNAFTLIEMMIVVLIIAILAALVVPNLLHRSDDAKVAKAKADVAEISSMLSQYRIDNDHYPTTEEGLGALTVAPADATNWKGPYSHKPISEDPWGTPYQYVSPGPNGQDFLITSYGQDKAPGGEGYAADITSDQ